jgi:hypothetical protein
MTSTRAGWRSYMPRKVTELGRVYVSVVHCPWSVVLGSVTEVKQHTIITIYEWQPFRKARQRRAEHACSVPSPAAFWLGGRIEPRAELAKPWDSRSSPLKPARPVFWGGRQKFFANLPPARLCSLYVTQSHQSALSHRFCNQRTKVINAPPALGAHPSVFRRTGTGCWRHRSVGGRGG